MKQTGAYSKAETIDAWADIVLKIWRSKITQMRVWNTGALYDSLLSTLLTSSGNDVDRVEFSFNLYGIFVDMGVGKELERGNNGDLGFTPTRKKKEWFSKVFYWQVMRLKEILTEKYGEDAARTIAITLNNNEA